MKAIQGEPAFAGDVCIKYLVVHIVIKVIKTRDFFKGTNHKDDWLFYHDALSLPDDGQGLYCVDDKNAGARDQDPAHHLFLLSPARAQPKQGVPEVP